MAAMLWFVILTSVAGSGTAQAMPVGPYASVAAFDKAYPGASGNGFNDAGYPTRAAAQAAASKYNAQPASKRQAGTVPPNEAPMIPGVHNPLKSPLGGLAAIGDFFSRLTQANTWIRMGEIVLGMILLAVGVARITHAVPAATKIATAVGAKLA